MYWGVYWYGESISELIFHFQSLPRDLAYEMSKNLLRISPEFKTAADGSALRSQLLRNLNFLTQNYPFLKIRSSLDSFEIFSFSAKMRRKMRKMQKIQKIKTNRKKSKFCIGGFIGTANPYLNLFFTFSRFPEIWPMKCLKIYWEFPRNSKLQPMGQPCGRNYYEIWIF